MRFGITAANLEICDRSGVCCGLPFFKGLNDDHFSATPLSSAVELGVLLASLSITSPDTINAEVNTESLYNFITKNNINADVNALKLFSDGVQTNHSKLLN